MKREETGQTESQLLARRREKLRRLRDSAQNYDNRVERWFWRDWEHTEHVVPAREEQRQAVSGIAELNREFADWGRSVQAQQAERIMISICGRLVGKRSNFFVLQDGSAGDCRIQLYVERRNARFAAEDLQRIDAWDVGDLVAVHGRLQRSRKGEGDLYITIFNDVRCPPRVLAKALRPLPEKYHGLRDPEMRNRQRYLEFLGEDASRRLFYERCTTSAELRAFFRARGFLEVETPMLHPVAGGAAARPFSTHHNALDMELFLRIAPELYLKRLVIGGFDRVFELNRCFRNEGLSSGHNPEFTMLEFYQAYSTFAELMELLEELLRGLVQARAANGAKLQFRGHACDFGPPFERRFLADAVLEKNPQLQRQEQAQAAWQLPGREALAERAAECGIEVRADWGAGKIALELFEKTAQSDLRGPVFITHYPAEVSPLSRCVDNRSMDEETEDGQTPVLAERFELFVGGLEIANGFSELNDPEEQRRRFERQAGAHRAGDAEAMPLDADYLRALEYGMPPTAGAGIGVDRLVMLLSGRTSIREVLLFPQLRPRRDD